MNNPPSHQMRNVSNSIDSFIFIFVFVFVILFFFLTLWLFNRGPIDEAVESPASIFTPEERTQRDQTWYTSSPAVIEKGKQLFEIMVLDDLQPIFDLIKAGEYGSTEVELYKVLTHGLPGTIFRRWDHLPRDARWQMVHYIRSEMSEHQMATDDEWEALKKEGI